MKRHPPPWDRGDRSRMFFRRLAAACCSFLAAPYLQGRLEWVTFSYQRCVLLTCKKKIKNKWLYLEKQWNTEFFASIRRKVWDKKIEIKRKRKSSHSRFLWVKWWHHRVSLAQAGLELAMEIRMSSNSWPSCFNFPNTETSVPNPSLLSTLWTAMCWEFLVWEKKKKDSEHTDLFVLWPLSKKVLKWIRVNSPMKQNTISQVW